jgi:hypothetical protein
MNIAAIRAALAAALSDLFSGRVYTEPPDQIVPPAAVIDGPEPIQYGETFEGTTHHLTFTVRVLVSRNVPRAAQSVLDDYMGDGSGSVYTALETDQNLGGTVVSALVSTAQNVGSITVNDITYAVVDFTVDVMV